MTECDDDVWRNEIAIEGEATGDLFNHPYFRQWSQLNEEEKLCFHDIWNSVVLVETPTGRGTGFCHLLGGTQYLITNKHVIRRDSSHDYASNEISLIFNYNAPGMGVKYTTLVKDIRFSGVSSTSIDYALLELNCLVSTLVNAIPTNASPIECSRVDYLLQRSPSNFYMIGHPNGGPKCISSLPDASLSSDKLFFVYDNHKSRPGSSGSPVVNSHIDPAVSPTMVPFLHFFSGKAILIASMNEDIRSTKQSS